MRFTDEMTKYISFACTTEFV